MKKNFIFLLLFATISAMAQKGQKVTLTGDVSKLKDPIEEVKLFYSNNNHSIDSCLVKDGKYIFEVDVSKPSVAVLQFRSKKGVHPPMETVDKFMFRLFIQPGEIITVSNIDSASNCKVTGAKWNDDYQEFAKGEIKSLVLLNARQTEIKKYKAAKDTINAKILEGGFKQYLDSLRSKSGIAFALAHPNSQVAILALRNSGGSPFNGERIRPAFSQLSLAIQQSEDGRNLKEKIDNPLKIGIGNIAPDFTQPDASGVQVSLASYRGKYVLLEFWANWCVFCRLESPFLIKAHEKYKDKGFDILSVSIDKKEDKKKWLAAIHEDGTSLWKQVSDLKGTSNIPYKLYLVGGLPANFLIDPQGKIIALNLRGDDVERKLAEVLK